MTSARLVDNDPLITDEMPNGEVLKVRVAAQYWSLELDYPELFYEEYAYLSTTLAEVKRTQDTIEVLLPQYENFRVLGDTSLTSIAAGQQGSTITITQTVGLVGTPNIGDLFKLSNGTKVYKITTLDTTILGTMVLGLYPDLAHTTDGTEEPVFNGILFTTTLSDDSLPIEDPTVDGLYQNFSLSLRETING